MSSRTVVAAAVLAVVSLTSACADNPAPSAKADTAAAETEASTTTTAAVDTSTMNITQIAASSPDFTNLVQAVLAAGLLSTLRDGGPFTVFAPTNGAFADLDPATRTAVFADPSGLLTDVLLLHVVPGTITSADLTEGSVLTTVGGGKLLVERDGNTIVVVGRRSSPPTSRHRTASCTWSSR